MVVFFSVGSMFHKLDENKDVEGEDDEDVDLKDLLYKEVEVETEVQPEDQLVNGQPEASAAPPQPVQESVILKSKKLEPESRNKTASIDAETIMKELEEKTKEDQDSPADQSAVGDEPKPVLVASEAPKAVPEIVIDDEQEADLKPEPVMVKSESPETLPEPEVEKPEAPEALPEPEVEQPEAPEVQPEVTVVASEASQDVPNIVIVESQPEPEIDERTEASEPIVPEAPKFNEVVEETNEPVIPSEPVLVQPKAPETQPEIINVVSEAPKDVVVAVVEEADKPEAPEAQSEEQVVVEVEDSKVPEAEQIQISAAEVDDDVQTKSQHEEECAVEAAVVREVVEETVTRVEHNEKSNSSDDETQVETITVTQTVEDGVVVSETTETTTTTTVEVDDLDIPTLDSGNSSLMDDIKMELTNGSAIEAQ